MQEGAMNRERDTGTRITRERYDCDKKGTQKRNEKIASSKCFMVIKCRRERETESREAQKNCFRKFTHFQSAHCASLQEIL